MNFHDKEISDVIKQFNSNAISGLSIDKVFENSKKYGKNTLTKKKKQSLVGRIFTALKEPMLLILIFGFILTFGINLGKYFKTGSAEFAECFGILGAVVLSVFITIIMEGSSQKAFLALSKIYDNIAVRVVRNGKNVVVAQQDVVAGDIVLLECGDKVVADGRLIESNYLTVDESALTGENNSVSKEANVVLSASLPLAERKNCLYSGTYVNGGSGKMVVTAVGDQTEIGNIAGELSVKNAEIIPLQQKLAKLGKLITLLGAICTAVVFILSIVKLAIAGNLKFSNVQELFISSIILIVAAVPEGLPTIVAVSLALNMIKLSKENALIKKITATETTGCVSVICSDKTGTITENKMRVVSVCANEFCFSPEYMTTKIMWQNFICNSTADVSLKNGKKMYFGSGTECALLDAYIKSKQKQTYKDIRKQYKVVDRLPFSGELKYMTTQIQVENGYRKLIKGAPEKVLQLCDLTSEQRLTLLKSMEIHQKKARRILCFAHFDSNNYIKDCSYIYDGFVALEDPIRKEVFKAVNDCEKAGIKVKILTGDNMTTAVAIAKELGIVKDEGGVLNGSDIEKLSDENLLKIIDKIKVVARSTPTIKLRIVRALKSKGEVVAVTGDGINDAPAIKHADVGIAMGVTGSEITKEAADVILLDDSFATVVKAVSFGRNVYKNLQRFILFQLSVNLSALLFIVLSAVFGFETPFNTFQLLWINVIMDGPPALTLGLEKASGGLMKLKPVKRNDSIVSKKMLARIMFNAVYISVLLLLQKFTNFLGAKSSEQGAVVFSLFVMLQMFNAFNCRELGSESILKNFGKNRIMVITFSAVIFVHFIIVQYACNIFGINRMGFNMWIKTILVASTIIIVSELYKFLYRFIKSKNVNDK